MSIVQRKAHKFIWLAMAVAIPILIFLAIRNLDYSVAELRSGEPLVFHQEGNRVSIELRVPFASPSVVVYELNALGEQGLLLGQLQGRGSYAFNTSPEATGLLVVDEIKEEELAKIQF